MNDKGCDYEHPQFGACDNGKIYGAVSDDELGRSEPVDYLCPRCNGGKALRDPQRVADYGKWIDTLHVRVAMYDAHDGVERIAVNIMSDHSDLPGDSMVYVVGTDYRDRAIAESVAFALDYYRRKLPEPQYDDVSEYLSDTTISSESE